MIRKIIKINEEKCDGCGLCANACHEGAIAVIDGKAKLVRDDYCDGLGNCLSVCPAGAIGFEEREAVEYNKEAVKANKAQKAMPLACGCPGTMARAMDCDSQINAPDAGGSKASMLRQWPVKIRLVPVNAPYFNGANLLVAADCAAYAHGDFHQVFMKDKITIIGCPKLDDVDYTGKISEIITRNDIKSITVVRMEVPCCGGITNAVSAAVKICEKSIPFEVITLSANGAII
jgi:NAD-dependent dihydropyrimidine dehydrogenase PreA subunit